MRKLRLNRRRGFTLVECVVAIAVFAVMTVMILMIVASATATSNKAQKNETDLNTLVENVVKDESIMSYNKNDSQTLEMYFGTNGASGTAANFAMTFTTVDGARNFITCPYCGESANAVNFLYKITETTAYTTDMADPNTVKKNYKLSHWFNPGAAVSASSTDEVKHLSRYFCPNCGVMIGKSATECTAADLTPIGSTTANSFTAPKELRCYTCTNDTIGDPAFTGSPYDMTKFDYDKDTGIYYCKNCGTPNVKEVGSGDSTIKSTDFSISGILPNAVRPKIDDPAPSVIKDFVTGISTGKVEITYAAAADKRTPGKYTVTVSNLPAGSETKNIAFKLPGNYILQSAGVTQVNMTESAQITKENGYNVLTLSNVGPSGITAKFTLKNEQTGMSFEDDFCDKVGTGTNALMSFWFGISQTSVKTNGYFELPRTGTDTATGFKGDLEDALQAEQAKSASEEESEGSGS